MRVPISEFNGWTMFPPSYYREHPSYYDDGPDGPDTTPKAVKRPATPPVDLPVTTADFIEGASRDGDDEQPF